SLSNEVDLDNAAKFGIDVVRRISGGGAMFMEAGSVVTYSLYAPGDLVRGMSFAESYAYLDDWVLEALRSLGIDATYQPLNDITSPAGKIGGGAHGSGAGGAHRSGAGGGPRARRDQVLHRGVVVPGALTQSPEPYTERSGGSQPACAGFPRRCADSGERGPRMANALFATRDPK